MESARPARFRAFARLKLSKASVRTELFSASARPVYLQCFCEAGAPQWLPNAGVPLGTSVRPVLSHASTRLAFPGASVGPVLF